MLTFNEAKQALEDMKGHFSGGFSYTEREQLEELNQRLFHKEISNKGCADCYRDAYIIISNKIKNMNEFPTPSNYILKSGVVVHPWFTHEFYALNIPDEPAEVYLAKNPENIKEFQKYPEDWQARVEARMNKQNAVDKETADETEIATNNAPESKIAVDMDNVSSKKKKCRRTRK